MKRVVNVESEYQKPAEKAIEMFFRKFPDLDYWRETLEYMNEHNEEFFCDNRFADGSINHEWAYALHLDKFSEKHTYIAIIERA